MASIGPIDKTRDAIKIQLEKVYAELALAEHPSVRFFDDRFTLINSMHPMLYQDLLGSWSPLGTFLSDVIVADGFGIPKLPFTFEPSVDPRREALGGKVNALIEEIGYYLSSDWTEKYRSMLDDYVLWRNDILSDAEKTGYAVELAIRTRGDVGRLLREFYAVLQPSYYETRRQLSWSEACTLLNAATTQQDVVDIIQDYCMTTILLEKGNQKYVREVPLPANLLKIVDELFDFLDEFNPPLINIQYICDSTFTEDLFLPILGEASLRRYAQSFHNVSEIATEIPISLPRRKKTLTVSAGKINLLVLYYAVRNGLPTLIFRKK
ncbi:hypothetical protein ACCH40_002429 [Salmonella enterica]